MASITKHFVPAEFFDSMSNQQMDGTLRKVLTNAVKQFSSDVLCTNILDELIDNHTNPVTIRNMQDKMINALVFEREKMFQKFFKISYNPRNGGEYPLVAKMKSEMVKLVKQNHLLLTKYTYKL